MSEQDPLQTMPSPASRPTVLIVEDDPDIAELITYHLTHNRCQAQAVHKGQLGLDIAGRIHPDLLILDLMLPDMDGLDVCKRLKNTPGTADIPILIVSARGEEADIVTGLELGADDYVTKPFSPRILLARVRTILRRNSQPSAPPSTDTSTIALAEGHLEIDLDRYEVRVGNEPVDLTKSEFEILRCLAAKVGTVRTRDQIIASLHGRDAVLTTRTIDVHMTALRRKLGQAGKLITTVRGVGYRLEEHLLSSDP